jgi:bile acid:Na+ symporter, BASS family
MTVKQLIMFAVQASIIFTVFSLGLRASFQDLLYVPRRPALLLRSLIAMFIAMPVLAIAVTKAFDLRPEVEIALVALSISPVPPLLPQREGKAGAHASFGLGLMVTMAILSVLLVPLAAHLMGLVFDQPLEMSAAAIAQTVALMAVLPMIAGVTFRKLWPQRAERWVRPAGLLGAVLLPLVGLVILYASHQSIIALIGNGTLAAMVGFVIAGLAIGHLLGGPDPHDRSVLALSTACRHPGIAVGLASANYPDNHQATAAILLYLVVNIVVCVPYVRWRRRALAVTSGT